MGEKCYFSTNELGYLNEPVMIGNTRLEDARVMNIIHEIERFDYTNRSTITIEGDLYPWCLGNNTGRVCGSFQWNVEKVIFSGPMTIVFWNDKSKTKVRLAADWDGRYDDRSEAIRWAMAKKFFRGPTINFLSRNVRGMHFLKHHPRRC